MGPLLLKEVIKSSDCIQKGVQYVNQLREKDVVIFGCSTTGKLILEALRSMAVYPLCFCDEMEADQIKEWKGVPVCKLDDIKQPIEQLIFVNSVNQEDLFQNVEQELEKRKIRNFVDKDLILYLFRRRHPDLILSDRVSGKDQNVIRFNKINFNITDRCTMNCRDCGELVPYVRQFGDSPLQMLKETIRNMAEIVDYITLVEVLGGEPFLHPDLGEVLLEIARYNKFLAIVVDTNGTVLPSQGVFEIMRENNIAVRITDYGRLSKRKTELYQKCLDNKVICTMRNVLVWDDFGPPELSSENEKQEKYKSCLAAQKCSSIYHGRWHICPRDAKLVELGLIDNTDEYVDLLGAETLEEKRAKMFQLRNRKEAIKSCRYCRGSDGKVTGGAQLPIKEKG